MNTRHWITVFLYCGVSALAAVAFCQTGVQSEIGSPGSEQQQPTAEQSVSVEAKQSSNLTEKRSQPLPQTQPLQGSDRLNWEERLDEYQTEMESAWNYEIIVIDNNSVTVKKVVFSLLILLVGLIASRYLIRFAVHRLARYARLKDSVKVTIQKVLSFAAYILVFLFALRMVNIPLAAFAFLGGAVAIGLGFGAQNLINNFISGFIIMGERPITIGDLIEIEGVLGQVEEIGARCTRVRTGENIHILVPNSSFLEKNITNWTLSDRNIRTRISVGVLYGSPVREVERLLIRAATESQQALKSPEPFVIFQDFGESALIFEVYFWVRVRQIIERRLIESGIRFRIDELFREAGITIAFPQLDVHLDTQRPLELGLTRADSMQHPPQHK